MFNLRSALFFGIPLLCMAILFAYGHSLKKTGAIIPHPNLKDAHKSVVEIVESACERVQKNPSSGYHWGYLGMVLMAHNLQPDALYSFQEAIRIQPENFKWHYYSAIIHEQTDVKKASELYAHAVSLNPNYAPVRFRWAKMLARLGKWDEAEDQFKHASKLAPQSMIPQIALGRLERSRKNFETARRHLERAVSMSPSNREARLELATLYSRLGQHQLAFKEQQQAAKLPEVSQVMNDPLLNDVQSLESTSRQSAQQADYWAARGNLPAAIKEYRILIRKHPDLSRPRINLANTFYAQGNLPEAISEFRKIIHLFPSEALAHYGLGLAQEASGREDQALKAYQECVQLKPDFAEVHFTLGLLLEKRKMLNQAIKSYRRAVEASPHFAPAQLALGVALKQTGEYSSAVTHIRRAVLLAPQDPVPRRFLDQALEAQQKAEVMSNKSTE